MSDVHLRPKFLHGIKTPVQICCRRLSPSIYWQGVDFTVRWFIYQ